MVKYKVHGIHLKLDCLVHIQLTVFTLLFQMVSPGDLAAHHLHYYNPTHGLYSPRVFVQMLLSTKDKVQTFQIYVSVPSCTIQLQVTIWSQFVNICIVHSRDYTNSVEIQLCPNHAVQGPCSVHGSNKVPSHQAQKENTQECYFKENRTQYCICLLKKKAFLLTSTW